MTVGRYAVGLAALAIVCASIAIGALSLRARLLAEWRGAPARLAEIVLGLALLIGILEVLGALGLFELGPIVVTCGAAAAALRAWSGRAWSGRAGSARAAIPNDAPPPPPAPRPATAAVAVAAIAAAAVIAEWAVPTLFSYDTGIRSFDSLWYHLPWAASFAQTGRVTSLHFTDVEYLTPFYPATAELIHGLGIVLVGRDTLSPGVNLGWLSLTLLAAWCIGRPRGLGPATLTGAALALATPMMRSSQAGSAANDIAGVFFLLAAVALIANTDLAGEGRAGAAIPPASAATPPAGAATPPAGAATPPAGAGTRPAGAGRPGATAPLVIAAIAAGLAVSIKLSLLAPVLALTIGTIVLARGRRGRVAAAWIPACFLASGYWYVRNLLAVGNPLPWLGLGILPTPAAPLQQRTGFAIIHYATDTRVWERFFAPDLAGGLGPWWAAVVAVAVLGPALCALGRSQPMAQMLGLVALASLVAYVLTPETAAGPAGHPSGFAFNLRYSAPGLTLALAVTPLAAWLDGARARAATLVVLAGLLVVTLAEYRLWKSGYLASAVLVGAAALVLFGAVVGLRRRPPAGAAVTGGAVALLAILAVLGYAGERHYLRGRYSYQPGGSSLAPVWAWARGIHRARIALVGTFGGFFAYPLAGLDDSNRVQYVAHHGPHGSFTPIRTCRAWRTALDAGHYRYVVTTPARSPWNPDGLEHSPEGAWTGSDPAAHLVLRNVSYGRLISVYELAGPLDPAGCPP